MWGRRSWLNHHIIFVAKKFNSQYLLLYLLYMGEGWLKTSYGERGWLKSSKYHRMSGRGSKIA